MGIKASGRLALIVAAGIWLWFSGPLQAQQVTGQTQAATGQQPVALGKPIALNKYAKRHSRHGRRHARSHSRRHHRVAKNEKSETKSSKRKDEAETKKSEALDAKVIESKSVELPATDAKTSDNKTADNKAANSNAGDTNQATPPAANQAIAAQLDQVTNNGNESAALSSSVANARAQLLSTTTTGNATTMTPAPTLPAPAATLNEGSSVQSPSLQSPPAASETAASTAVVPSDQLNDVDRSLNDNKEPAPTIALATINTPQPAAAATPTAQASNDESTWAQTSMIGKMFIAFGGLLTLASAARMLIA
ncbi:MAG TPA: hypothetical protein VGM35_04445 [Xanthobacteraceae bacterium]|jgi:hypothetical protein